MYEKGQYKQSVDALVDALITLEAHKSKITKDISDMMYARAKANEQQLLLSDANQKISRTNTLLSITVASIILVIIASYFFVQYIRRRQWKNFINFKLNLAKSIHDEANPALLYTKALIRSKLGNLEGKEELEKQVDYTMQLIRSLSHDLKSDSQIRLSDLVNETQNTLDKLNVENNYVVEIQENVDKNRFLSHFQFTQLKAVLYECITNTIKYANFDKININFKQKNNKLSINYSDNGQGWPQDAQQTGIGLANMHERIDQLNEEFYIYNNYPNGFYITFSIFLK